MKKKFMKRAMVAGLCAAMTTTSLSPACASVDLESGQSTREEQPAPVRRKASDSNANRKASSSNAADKASPSDAKAWLMRNSATPPAYLSSMEFTGSQAGYGKWTMDKDFDTNKPIELKLSEDSTTIFEKGMTANAEAWITYDVSEYGGKIFFAYAGVHYGQISAPSGSGDCDFKVEIDGITKWESSKVLSAADIAEKAVVEIPEGAKELKLWIGKGGDDGKYDHGVWAKASIVENKAMLKAMETLSVNAPSYLEVGAEGKMTVRGKLFDETEARFGEDIIVSCESDNEDIATVDGEGGSWKVNGIGDGIAVITVTAVNENTGEYLEQSVEILVGEDEENTRSVESPNGEHKLLFTLTPAGKLQYRVVTDANEEMNVMAAGVTAGLDTNLGDFSNDLEWADESVKTSEVTDSYELLGAKKSHVEAAGNEMVLSFKKKEPAKGAEDVTFRVIARAYDDGVAFRYQISAEEKKKLTISEEKTAFVLPDEAVSQAMEFVNHNEAREKEKTNSQLTGAYCMPLLYESNGTYGLISEAALSQEYAGAAFYGDGTGKLDVRFSSGDLKPTTKVETSTSVQDPWAEGEEHPWESPWRFVVMGDLNTINSNTMAETLSPEAVIDTDWIEPGACAWTWLNGEGTSSFETYKKYVDLAAEMGWEYVLLDEGWQPKVNSGGYVYKGYFDWFDDLMEYADEKGVGVFVWANNADLNTPEKQEVISEWAAKGVKGVKPDFFNSHSQEQMKIYMQLIQKTAENHMILNIHGAPKATGERRTYPHLLTREGIHGAEQILFDSAGVTARHNCMLPFVRNAVGPADYTPMLSVDKHNSPYGGGNTYSYQGHYTAGQMAAMPVIIETGINCMADRADIYLNSATRPLYERMPAAWDNSSVLDADLGSYVAIERETSDGRWYIGVINDEARQADLDMSFLPEDGEFYAYIVEDGNGPDVLTIRTEKVTSEDMISLELKEAGGALIMIQSEALSEVTEITLNKELVELTMGKTETLTASVAPDDAKIKNVIWESSDEKVVKVEKGRLTPVGIGIATVKASCGSAAAVCEVRVYPDEYLKLDRWEVINEDLEYWTLNSENSLTVTTQSGGIYTNSKNTANNEFMIEADRDFEASVKLTFAPEADYQAAGLLILGDENSSSSHKAESYAGLWRRYHSSFGGNVLNMVNYNGKLGEDDQKADHAVNDPIWLKLVKDGNTITSYTSEDGITWEQLGTGENVKLNGAEIIKVGVYAGNDQPSGKPQAPNSPAVFENFTYKVKESEAEIIPFGQKSLLEVMGVKLETEGRTEYALGDEFDPSGYTFTAYYTDGTSEEISGNDCEVTGFDSLEIGVKEVQFTYQGKSVTVEVNVISDEEPEPEPDPTDPAEEAREKLKAAVDRLKAELSALNSKDYTQESWDKLQAALKQAEAVAEDEDAAQQKIERMMKDLADARNGLEKTPEPEPDPEPEPTPEPTPDSGSSSDSGSDSSYTPAVSSPGVNAVTGTWTMTQNGAWQFTSGGQQYKNEWAAVTIPNADASKGQETYAWYRFDENGYMITGWFTDTDGAKYYFQEEVNGSEGRMMTGWVQVKDADGSMKWYYFNPVSDGTRGKMLVNTTTPDGYRVDENGVWMEF